VRKTIIKILGTYGTCIMLSLLVSFWYANSKGVSTLPQLDQYKVWCDAFAIPGLMLGSMGLLIVLSNSGSFDGFSWAMRFAMRTLIPFGRLKKTKKYGDFVLERREHPIVGYHFMFHVGVVDLIICFVFLYLFHSN